jgi:hypothetical protein
MAPVMTPRMMSGMVWLKNRFYSQIHGLSIQQKVYKFYENAATQRITKKSLKERHPKIGFLGRQGGEHVLFILRW